jgi:hypothetical protein
VSSVIRRTDGNTAGRVAAAVPDADVERLDPPQALTTARLARR